MQFYITIGFHIGGMRKFKVKEWSALLADNSSELCLTWKIKKIILKIILTKKKIKPYKPKQQNILNVFLN